MRLNGSSGHFGETVADVVSVGYDVYDIYDNGLSWESSLSLAADVGGLAAPVPAGVARLCNSAARH